MVFGVLSRKHWLATTALVGVCVLGSAHAFAADATWVGGVNGSVDNASNWNPTSVPTGVGSTATFDTSAQTALTTNGNPWGTWLFNVGASAYTLSVGGATSFGGSGIVINGGSLDITATAAIEFLNSASAGTATIASNTSIDFLNSSTAGDANITYNGGTSTFQGTSNAGTAQLNVSSGATLRFQGTSTAANSTIANSGNVYFQGNSTGGLSEISTAASAVTDFSQTTGPLSDGKISAGFISGAGTYYLGSNELTVGGLNIGSTVSGVIADGGAGGGTAGSLVKTGTGTFSLNGTNTYTGATTVNGGALQVLGSIATSSGVNVNNTGRLTGTGTVSNVSVASGGTFAPGDNTPGTAMTVNGNLTMVAGSNFAVRLNPTTSTLANVSGTASLGGATVQANFANGSYVAKQYTILEAAGGVSGVFATNAVSTNLPTNFKATTSTDATKGYLDLALAFVAPAPGTGANQVAVGNSLVNYFNTNGGINMVYSGLTANGLAQASGETSTGAQQSSYNAMNGFMNTLFSGGSGFGGASGGAAIGYADDERGTMAYSPIDRVRNAYAAVTGSVRRAPSPFEQRWSVWAAGFGGSQTTDGNIATGAASTQSNIYGSAVGADYRISRDTVAGFALAGGGTNFSIGSFGTGRSEFAQGGAFVKHNVGPAYINAALAYGWQDVTTDRTVTINGVDRLRADFATNTLAGRVEGGYRLLAPYAGGVGITPYAAAQVTSMWLPSYSERVMSGANTFALSYASKDVTNTRTELGLRTDKSFAMTDGVLTLRGRAAWAHDFNPDRAASATFQALPGATFVVNGSQQAANSALASASAEMNWLNGWSIAGTFDGEFSNVSQSYTGKGAVRYRW